MSKSKILVIGLSGSGKTYFSEMLMKNIDSDYYNADIVRRKYNDWDFSYDGRYRQLMRMVELSNNSLNKYVICDFICPLEKFRKLFEPTILVFMNTVKKSKYEDTDNIFEIPYNYDYIINEKNDNLYKDVCLKIKNQLL